MKNNTMPRNVTLSRTELRELRQELERERARFEVEHPRFHVVNEALRRMESGSYGACVLCDVDIPYGRLSVMPETLYCVTCGARA
ncbi:MAG TPA: TraR/DksA C4-type zinc finger protein [Gemmatimonadaceae bacterium]|nr:TraR/DksA C4-type zinc finger protein [Gemmatimonadaceae bacterium]